MVLGISMLFYFARKDLCPPGATGPPRLALSKVHTKPFYRIVELNIAIIVSCVPGFSKFIRTFETDWQFVKFIRSKVSGYSGQKLTGSYKSSQKENPSQPRSSTQIEPGMPAYPATVAGHSKSNSLSYAQDQMYNSWELDSYLDTEDSRHSWMQTRMLEDPLEYGTPAQCDLAQHREGISHV